MTALSNTKVPLCRNAVCLSQLLSIYKGESTKEGIQKTKLGAFWFATVLGSKLEPQVPGCQSPGFGMRVIAINCQITIPIWQDSSNKQPLQVPKLSWQLLGTWKARCQSQGQPGVIWEDHVPCEVGKETSQQSAKGTAQNNTLFCRYNSICTTSKLTLLYELSTNYSKLNAFVSGQGGAPPTSLPKKNTIILTIFGEAGSWCEVTVTRRKHSLLHNSSSALCTPRQ